MPRLIQCLAAVWRIILARLSQRHDWRYQAVRECEHLGGVYIKFLQMLAIHESTKHMVEGIAIDRAFEQVAFEPIDIYQQLGSGASQFQTIDSAPFAAGSYGQVYSARLLQGQEVIIKVLRPSVRKSLKTDLRILQMVARVAGWFAPAIIINPRLLAREFAQTTLAETDYVREARNAEWLRSYFNERPGIVVPKTYNELCTKHVLVQERIGGISLAEVQRCQQDGQAIDQVVFQQTGSTIWRQLHTLGVELLRATLYADYLMVDPHPGNIRLLADDRVALIDFGMIAKAPKNRGAFANLIGEFYNLYSDNFKPEAFAVAMLAFLDVELHDALEVVARAESRDLVSSLGEFVGGYLRSRGQDSLVQHYLSDRQMAKLFNEVLNRQNKLGLHLTEQNALLQRSMNMYMSIVRNIGDRHDGAINFTIIRNVLYEVHQEVIKHGFSSVPQSEMSEETALEITANWLTVIAERDRLLYRSLIKGSYA